MAEYADPLMPTWKPFRYRGTLYDLSHLEPFLHTYIQPAQEGKPARFYRVWIRFGHHCFTRDPTERDDPGQIYPSQSDRRCFDVKRWVLSKHLPEIVRSLMGRKIFHTGHGNFFTIEVMAESGEHLEYEVYFEVNRDRGDRQLYLVVTSAFPRDPARLASRPHPRSIGLQVILFNTQTGKPIRTQR